MKQKNYSVLTNASEMGDKVLKVCPSKQWSLAVSVWRRKIEKELQSRVRVCERERVPMCV